MSEEIANAPDLIAFCGRIVEAATDPRALELEGARNFPWGMCTWMSFAAGELLREHGFGTWRIQNAQDPDRGLFHDWLVRGDTYIDLTAHQFAEFGTYLVGVGRNPVTSRFPELLKQYPTSGIGEHPPIITYKEQLAAIITEQ